jgi:hypothetical protein
MGVGARHDVAKGGLARRDKYGGLPRINGQATLRFRLLPHLGKWSQKTPPLELVVSPSAAQLGPEPRLEPQLR